MLAVLGLDMAQCGKIGYCVESNRANEEDVSNSRWGIEKLYNRAGSLYLETMAGRHVFSYQDLCERLTILR